MFGFTRKPPKAPWVYLGWSEVKYVDEKGETVRQNTVHFYARGDGMKERRFEYEGKGKYDTWGRHPWIQRVAVPWSEGENLWSAMKHPSENLKDWTKSNCGFEWKGDRWFKPSAKIEIEGNVFKFPAKA